MEKRSMKIEFVDLKKQYLSIKREIDLAVQNVLNNCSFVGGEDVKRFEDNFATACGSKHCISVGNGTDALYISMRALGVGPGDEVITVANSYFATSEAITMAGARPVFVDCDKDTYLLDPNKLEELLKKKGRNGALKVKAVLPVHLYGRVCAMDPILQIARQYGLKVIEDCAQAHFAEDSGRKAGSIGDAGCFSFYPSKNLGCFGDGGAILTNNDEWAASMRMISNHGQMSRYDHRLEGINSRLDTLQAAILNVKLPHLATWSENRYANALLYQKRLHAVAGIIPPTIPAANSHVFHLYVVRAKNRDAIMQKLDQMGVPTIVHYPVALPNLPVYQRLGYQPGDFSVASALQHEIFSLPMFPELTEEEIEHVTNCLKNSLA